MLMKAILVALVYYVCSTAQWFGVFHANRPIVIGTLIGLVLGDLRTGLILGAAFEAAFLGVVAIGGSMPADASIGSAFGASLAIMGGLDWETALALAMPISMLGMYLMVVPINLINPLLYLRAKKLAAVGNDKALAHIPYISGVLQYIFSALIVGLGVFIGADAIGGIMAKVPMVIIGGLSATGKMLPALGMALLLNMLFDKKIIVFFFVGFILSIYLGLPSIAIAVLAIAIGIFAFVMMSNNDKKVAVSTIGANDKEDFLA